MKIIVILNLITAVTSLIAAILWLISTFFKIKRKDNVTMAGASIKDMAIKIVKQSKFNGWAALFATFAALAQAIVFFLK